MAAGALAVGLGAARERGVAVAVAGALLVAVLGGAALVGRRIRRREWLQLGSAVGLAALVVPIEWAAGADRGRALADAAALAVLFIAGALSVRATFHRARRQGAGATLLGVVAVVAPLGLALGFGFTGRADQALVAGLAAAVALALAIARPLPRRLRRLGLLMAAATVAAVVILVV